MLAVALLVGAATGCAAGSGPTAGDRSPSAPASASSPISSGTPTAALSPAPPVRTVTVTVSGGTVTPKPGRVKVGLGEPLSLRVSSDVADEIHVHGYDLRREVAAGGTATLTFAPDLPGIFEVELESRGLRLLDLQVS